MKKQITHICVHQTSKVLALLCFVLTLLVCIPIGLYSLFYLSMEEAAVFFILPFFYLIAAYIGIAIHAWFYNLIAGSFGGVQVVCKDIGQKEKEEPEK